MHWHLCSSLIKTRLFSHSGVIKAAHTCVTSAQRTGNIKGSAPKKHDQNAPVYMQSLHIGLAKSSLSQVNIFADKHFCKNYLSALVITFTVHHNYLESNMSELRAYVKWLFLQFSVFFVLNAN